VVLAFAESSTVETGDDECVWDCGWAETEWDVYCRHWRIWKKQTPDLRPVDQFMQTPDLQPVDQCPVCKSDRYLNPNLRLLVSPCYHRMIFMISLKGMCTTCIDRLFTSGPAPCPICKQSLRKSNFIAQTFEDLSVEREVCTRSNEWSGPSTQKDGKVL
jgi:hypothetical protein